MKSQYTEAIKIMEDISIPGSVVRLKAQRKQMDDEAYRIAVLGEFKAGKSTFINRYFLKEDILHVDLLEATAVPTEIDYGAEKRLEVYPIRKTSETFTIEETAQTADVFFEEGDMNAFPNPAVEDIKRQTTADTAEDRAILAQKTARVRLSWPAKNLKGLTIFDTPGINSPNEAVVSTVYRIIPKTDVVLFLTGAKMLSQTEITFLRSRVFSTGISRAMIVMYYNPIYVRASEGNLEKVAATIRSQIADIGRDLPIEIVRMTEGATHPKPAVSIAERIEKEKDSGDWFDITAPVSAQDDVTPPPPGTDAFEDRLIRFIRDNVRPARMEKGRNILRREVEQAIIACRTELAALEKTAAERDELLTRMNAKATALDKERESMLREFLADLHVIWKRHAAALTRGMNKIKDDYIAAFDKDTDIGAIKNRLTSAPSILRTNVEELLHRVTGETRQEVANCRQKYEEKFRVISLNWADFVTTEIHIDGGLLARTPSWLVFIADMILSIMILPFGPIGDLITRWIATKIPFLRPFLPYNLAKALLLSNIKTNLNDQFDQMNARITQESEAAFLQAEEEMKARFAESWQADTSIVTDSIKRAQAETDGGQRASTLKEAHERLTVMLRALETERI
ncbi:MAG: dynamin family protein [Syntrophales bacterium]